VGCFLGNRQPFFFSVPLFLSLHHVAWSFDFPRSPSTLAFITVALVLERKNRDLCLWMSFLLLFLFFLNSKYRHSLCFFIYPIFSVFPLNPFSNDLEYYCHPVLLFGHPFLSLRPLLESSALRSVPFPPPCTHVIKRRRCDRAEDPPVAGFPLAISLRCEACAGSFLSPRLFFFDPLQEGEESLL